MDNLDEIVKDLESKMSLKAIARKHSIPFYPAPSEEELREAGYKIVGVRVIEEGDEFIAFTWVHDGKIPLTYEGGSRGSKFDGYRYIIERIDSGNQEQEIGGVEESQMPRRN